MPAEDSPPPAPLPAAAEREAPEAPAPADAADAAAPAPAPAAAPADAAAPVEASPAPPALAPPSAPSPATSAEPAADLADVATTTVPPLVTASAPPTRSLGARLRPHLRALALAALVLGPVTITFLVLALGARARAGRVAPVEETPATLAPATLALPVTAPSAPPEPEPAVDRDAGAPPSSVWRVADLASDPDVALLTATVGKRAFSAALAASGVPRAEVARIASAFTGLRRFDRCAATDTFTVARSKKTGKLLAFEYAPSPVDVWQARATDGGGLEGKRLDLRVEHVAHAVALALQDDLLHAITGAGLDDDLVGMIDDALHGHVDIGRIRAGARLRVLAREDRVEGAFGRYAELEALEYLPAQGGAPLRVYHFTPPPRSRATLGFYDAKGRQPFLGGWRCPVPLARLSSRFNPRRVHPVLHVVMPHNGIDYAAPPGTPVYATAAGTVQSAGDGGPCGNMVQVLHSNGLVSAYCHLSRFGPIHPGQHVEGRQLLGYVGQTGRVTGPHLHFAIKRGEMFIDPLALKLDGVRVLPPADREAFARRREELDARLDAVLLPAATPLAGDAGASDPEVFFEEPPDPRP